MIHIKRQKLISLTQEELRIKIFQFFRGYDFTGCQISNYSIDFFGMGIKIVQCYCSACDHTLARQCQNVLSKVEKWEIRPMSPTR